MGWGYSTHMYNSARIPVITGFEFMRDHFKSVEPIRGRAKECKPLGKNRRYSWFEVRENTNCYMTADQPLGWIEKSYSCHLWGTDMLEFYKDGSVVVRDTTWHTPTAMGFLTHCLTNYGTIASHDGKWYFKNKAGEAYLLPDYEKDRRTGLRLVAQGEGERGIMRPTNPIQEYTFKAKRKELNKLRKYYKEFMDYTRTMLAMDGRITMDTGEALGFANKSLTPQGWHGRQHSKGNRELFFRHVQKAMDTGDLDLSYSLAQYVGACFAGYDYTERTYACTPKGFERGFTEMLKYQHHEVVFEKEEYPIGCAFPDKNKKYTQ